LNNLLQFDPEKRMTVEQALAHPYLESYHDVADEPSHSQVFDFSFEVVEGIEEMKGIVLLIQ
jgi:mitogen-activated protein kinase 7